MKPEKKLELLYSLFQIPILHITSSPEMISHICLLRDKQKLLGCFWTNNFIKGIVWNLTKQLNKKNSKIW